MNDTKKEPSQLEQFLVATLIFPGSLFWGPILMISISSLLALPS